MTTHLPDLRPLVGPRRDEDRMSAERLGVAVEQMFAEIPNDWWRFVPCATCNASRQRPCQAMDGPARGPHAPRRRAGLGLHGTLWLLRNGFESDVFDTPDLRATARNPDDLEARL